MRILAFNARIETLTEKPFFRDPIKHKRCIIPASGFYEWQKIDDMKQPYYIHRTDKQPLAFAGLWDSWSDINTGEVVESCTIVTVPAIHQKEQIHDRMPAILEVNHYGEWLDESEPDVGGLLSTLRSPCRDALRMYPVSSYVNNVSNDGTSCIVPLHKSGA